MMKYGNERLVNGGETKTNISFLSSTSPHLQPHCTMSTQLHNAFVLRPLLHQRVINNHMLTPPSSSHLVIFQFGTIIKSPLECGSFSSTSYWPDAVQKRWTYRIVHFITNQHLHYTIQPTIQSTSNHE